MIVTQREKSYCILKSLVVLLAVSVLPGFVYAQSIKALPPGGAALLSLPGQEGSAATIDSFVAPKNGTAYFLHGKTQLVYKAPTAVEEELSVSITYKKLRKKLGGQVFIIDFRTAVSRI